MNNKYFYVGLVSLMFHMFFGQLIAMKGFIPLIPIMGVIISLIIIINAMGLEE